MEKNTGLFICHCGKSLHENINIEKLFQEAWQFPKIAYVGVSSYLCSEKGLKTVLSVVKKYNLGYIVIAACSPVLIESTFQKTIGEAGIDSQFISIVNIREQCSWAHRDIVTEKAIETVRMAVNRIHFSKTIPIVDVDISKKILVIGGNSAGVKAALNISRLGFMTTLLDRNPGLLTNNSVLFNQDFKKKNELLLDELKVEKNIRIVTNAMVMAINGTIGNFSVKIKQNHQELILHYGVILFTTGNFMENTPVNLGFKSTTILSFQILNKILDFSLNEDLDPIIRKAKTVAFIFNFSANNYRYIRFKTSMPAQENM